MERIAGRRQVPVYGTPEFVTLTEMAWRMAHRGRWAATATLLRHPAKIGHLWAVLRLPVADIQASSAELRDWKANRYLPALGTSYGGRRAQAVLELPSSAEEYVAGGHRQALRTNIARSQRSGVTTRVTASYEEWVSAASAVLAQRRDGRRVAEALVADGPHGRLRLLDASNPGGEPVAVAAVALVGDAALLVTLLSVPGHPLASDARYLIHSALVADLIALGQRHLVVGSALRQPSGIQYFQHLLGYRPANLRPRPRRAVL